MRIQTFILATGAAVAALINAPAVAAQSPTPAASGAATPDAAQTATVYGRDYFDQFGPLTALNMVERVPGFTIDFGDGRRGFEGAGGNVLIDGARARSKSGGVREALERIPAGQVDRIELIVNPTTTAASGQTVIVDVILRTAKQGGTWQVSMTRDRSAIVSPWLSASYATPWDGWEVAATAEIGTQNDPNIGTRVRSTATGALALFETEARDNEFDRWAFSIEAKRAAFGGDIVVNARASGEMFEASTLRKGFATAAPGATQIQTRNVRFAEDTRDGEVSLALTRPLAGAWRLEALSLASWRELTQASVNLVDAPVGVFSSGAQSNLQRESLEWIWRAVIKPPDRAGWRREFGGEIAYNRVESVFDLATLAPDRVVTPVRLPAADIVVDEWRSQAFATLSRPLGRTWTIDGGLAFESSRIAVSGGAQGAQTVSLIKPSIALAWKPTQTLTLRGEVRREAGQLDFDAFAASAELGVDRTFGGNPTLRPDTTTRASLDIDYRVSGGLAMNIAAFHEWRSDVLEPIILPSGDFGDGNAGDARVWGVSARVGAALPLGLRADARAQWRQSRFLDPMTGRSRPINGFTPLTYGAELRQDIKGAGLAWGARVSKEGVQSSIFVTEEQTFDFGFERSVYLERTLPRGVKATLTVSEPLPREFRQERTFFTPARPAAFAGREVRTFERGPDVTVRLEGRF